MRVKFWFFIHRLRKKCYPVEQFKPFPEESHINISVCGRCHTMHIEVRDKCFTSVAENYGYSEGLKFAADLVQSDFADEADRLRSIALWIEEYMEEEETKERVG